MISKLRESSVRRCASRLGPSGNNAGPLADGSAGEAASTGSSPAPCSPAGGVRSPANVALRSSGGGAAGKSAAAGEQQQQQQQQEAASPASPAAPAAPQPPAAVAPAGSFTAAKKTLGRLFAGVSALSLDSAGGAPSPLSPSGAGAGLIAAFRSMMPAKTTSSGAAANNSSSSSASAGGAAPPVGAALTPPAAARRSRLLAVCPQLPPSMQRAEWCLDDYVVHDKLYTGYASVGERLPSAALAMELILPIPARGDEKAW